MARDYSNKLTLRPQPSSTPFPINPISVILVAVDPNGCTKGAPGDVAFLAGGPGQWRCLGGMTWVPFGGVVSHAALLAASLVATASKHTGSPGSLWTFDSLGESDELTGVHGTLAYRNGLEWVALPPGVAGQFLRTAGPGADPSWAAPLGDGDVLGPGASTGNALVRWDGLTGTLIKNSCITLTDTGDLVCPGGSTLAIDAITPATPGSDSVVLAGVRHYASAPTDPVFPAPADGDVYYNTALQMEMRYDQSRAKWLSVATATFSFGRDGNTPTGGYYRAVDNRVMSALVGYRAEQRGTVVALTYTRTSLEVSTFEITAGGVTVASLIADAPSGQSTTLNGSFPSGSILSARNAPGGHTTSNIVAYFTVRWQAP